MSEVVAAAEGQRQKAEGVPEGWEATMLGEQMMRIVGGGTPDRQNPEYWTDEKGIPWLTVKDMTQRYITDAKEHITEIGLKESASNLIPSGTVIMSTRMAVGRTVICGVDSAINQDLKALFPRPTLENDFLKVISERIEPELDALGTGSTVKGIRLEQLRAFPILLPPLPEQRKIAAILSTWDDSLTTLAQLLAAKRQQKRGLAEALLTGKKRLKGFEGEWEEKKLGDVFQLLIGGTPSRKEAAFWDSEKTTENVWLSIADLKEKYASDSKEYISDLGIIKSNVKRVPAKTIVMSFKLTLGRAAITTRTLYTNEAICAFVPISENIVDTEYFYQSIALMDFTEGVDIAVKGATMNKEKLTNFSISLPPLPEQQAIASILSTLDGEIALLEALRGKVQQQKRGLMDELLTGRVRVAVGDGA